MYQAATELRRVVYTHPLAANQGDPRSLIPAERLHIIVHPISFMMRHVVKLIHLIIDMVNNLQTKKKTRNQNPSSKSVRVPRVRVRPTTAIMLPPLWVLLHRGRREVGLRRRRRRRNHILLFGGAN